MTPHAWLLEMSELCVPVWAEKAEEGQGGCSWGLGLAVTSYYKAACVLQLAGGLCSITFPSHTTFDCTSMEEEGVKSPWRRSPFLSLHSQARDQAHRRIPAEETPPRLVLPCRLKAPTFPMFRYIRNNRARLRLATQRMNMVSKHAIRTKPNPRHS